MTLGELKPMAAMNQWEWKQTMLKGCDMIDEFLMDRERPSINGDSSSLALLISLATRQQHQPAA
jgi:hypothetical protein